VDSQSIGPDMGFVDNSLPFAWRRKPGINFNPTTLKLQEDFHIKQV
jgi:hypothetical protein